MRTDTGIMWAAVLAVSLTACGSSERVELERTPFLTVSIPEGGGSISSSPSGIACEAQCSANFPAGKTITLIATPQPGYRFDHFEGACRGMQCTLQLAGDAGVTAHFSSVMAKACDDDSDALTTPMQHYRGLIHAHTGYSDGAIDSTPHDVFKAGYDNGLDFAIVTDHSDTLNDLLYLSVGSDCFNSLQGLLTCLVPQAGDFRKWPVAQQQADADQRDDFVAARGFEWTSDRFGHINVLFSSNFTNAKLDGGYIGTMDTFWAWLPRTPGPDLTAGITSLGGGGDGIGIFNHPGDKCLSTDDAGCNWNDFAYVAAVDPQMVGLELFNSGTSGDRPDAGRKDGYADDYMRALDHGWHVGAIGAEDMHDTTWGLPSHPKTVVIAPSLDRDALKSAMLARRMYALVGSGAGEDLIVSLDAESHAMGSRLSCTAGASVPLHVRVSLPSGEPFAGIIRLYDHADAAAPLNDGFGSPLLSVNGDALDTTLPVATDGNEHWFFVRIDNADGQSLAYSSPIWIRAR